MKPILASQSSEETSLPTRCSSTSSPQNCETLCFCHFSHLVVVLILRQPKELIRHPQRKMSSQAVGSSLAPCPRRRQSSTLISACSWGLCHHGHSCFQLPVSRQVFSVPHSNDSSMKSSPSPQKRIYSSKTRLYTSLKSQSKEIKLQIHTTLSNRTIRIHVHSSIVRLFIQKPP